eukprot:m.11364 g.11364  ORF g.11364 m.11364 type:complete len:916 (-) comp2625_c0_seq1:1052-3799(-)
MDSEDARYEQSVVDIFRRVDERAKTGTELLRAYLQNEIFVSYFNEFMVSPIFAKCLIYSADTESFSETESNGMFSGMDTEDILGWVQRERLPYLARSQLFMQCKLAQLLAAEHDRLASAHPDPAAVLGTPKGLAAFRASLVGTAGHICWGAWIAAEMVHVDADSAGVAVFKDFFARNEMSFSEEEAWVLRRFNASTALSTSVLTVLDKVQQIAFSKLVEYWCPRFLLQVQAQPLAEDAPSSTILADTNAVIHCPHFSPVLGSANFPRIVTPDSGAASARATPLADAEPASAQGPRPVKSPPCKPRRAGILEPRIIDQTGDSPVEVPDSPRLAFTRAPRCEPSNALEAAANPVCPTADVIDAAQKYVRLHRFAQALISDIWLGQPFLAFLGQIRHPTAATDLEFLQSVARYDCDRSIATRRRIEGLLDSLIDIAASQPSLEARICAAVSSVLPRLEHFWMMYLERDLQMLEASEENALARSASPSLTSPASSFADLRAFGQPASSIDLADLQVPSIELSLVEQPVPPSGDPCNPSGGSGTFIGAPLPFPVSSEDSPDQLITIRKRNEARKRQRSRAAAPQVWASVAGIVARSVQNKDFSGLNKALANLYGVPHYPMWQNLERFHEAVCIRRPPAGNSALALAKSVHAFYGKDLPRIFEGAQKIDEQIDIVEARAARQRQMLQFINEGAKSYPGWMEGSLTRYMEVFEEFDAPKAETGRASVVSSTGPCVQTVNITKSAQPTPPDQQDLTMVKIAADPSLMNDFRQYLFRQGGFMEMNLMCWQQLQIMIDGTVFNSRIVDSLLKFIRSPIPPTLRVDLPVGIAKRLTSDLKVARETGRLDDTALIQARKALTDILLQYVRPFLEDRLRQDHGQAIAPREREVRKILKEYIRYGLNYTISAGVKIHTEVVTEEVEIPT